MPDEPEVHGLLALMLLHDARREARFADGELVLLEDQDRSLWNDARSPRVARASTGACPARARAVRAPGGDRLRAHRRADRLAEVAALYGELARADRLTGRGAQPRRRGRRGRGPEAALGIVDGLELDDYQYLHSTRAELLGRLGRTDEARAAYRRALELRPRSPERRFLERRLAEL